MCSWQKYLGTNLMLKTFLSELKSKCAEDVKHQKNVAVVQKFSRGVPAEFINVDTDEEDYADVSKREE